MKLKFWILSLPTLFLFSCQSPKNIAYLQNFDTYLQSQSAEENVDYEAKIKCNDRLLITVSSPVLNQEQVAQFNLPMNTYLTPGQTTLFQSSAIQTFAVDKDGAINYPVIGMIQIAGLRRSEAVELIKEQVAKFIPDPIVNIQFISFKVTVLGEVARVGQIEVHDERISIFDALGAAGDLTIYGDRRHVNVIRENNGKKSLQQLDLTQSSIFTSPYYYLQQNDVVYVEPNKTRKKDSRISSNDNFVLSVYSISLSTISLLVTLYNVFLK
ncbi:MAG: hypothetical protein EZS26_001429 [Candidatus Ordinivivax streblomastigis]|uniref:Polysaccharide export outer membrane protein n=1 Tax=Candidatus Ordinivivax streblomastigis TaxID=2540710 RepID=A0A5M8P1T5_9BACT|nr:MAG: hypothetical protein EZS26_001429 [Candidatus Ordinivivax streblomastigis]